MVLVRLFGGEGRQSANFGSLPQLPHAYVPDILIQTVHPPPVMSHQTSIGCWCEPMYMVYIPSPPDLSIISEQSMGLCGLQPLGQQVCISFHSFSSKSTSSRQFSSPSAPTQSAAKVLQKKWSTTIYQIHNNCRHRRRHNTARSSYSLEAHRTAVPVQKPNPNRLG